MLSISARASVQGCCIRGQRGFPWPAWTAATSRPLATTGGEGVRGLGITTDCIWFPTFLASNTEVNWLTEKSTATEPGGTVAHLRNSSVLGLLGPMTIIALPQDSTKPEVGTIAIVFRPQHRQYLYYCLFCSAIC